MTPTTRELISDEEIDAHHFGSFGGHGEMHCEVRREILEEGLLKALMGYHSGSTVTTILHRHKLITQRGGRPTAKGLNYLRSMWGSRGIRETVRWLDTTKYTGES